MTGRDLIHLAGHLAVNRALGTNAEARYRSAASRAYYGAFHLARACLSAHFQIHVLQNHHGHRQAYDELVQIGELETIRAAQSLDDLRRFRNKADYDLNSTEFKDDVAAKQCVELADRVRADLERLEP